MLKRGKEGSLALVDGRVVTRPAFPVREVDPIGAGDAFDRGISPHACGDYPPEERLRTANAMGALSVATLGGDYEGLPDKGGAVGLSRGRKDLGR